MNLNSTLNSQIISPVSKGATEKIGSINAEDLTNAYGDAFGIDISEIIGDLREVEIYKCIDTGYKFYFPFHIQGDEELYNSLANRQWYYLKDKWEFFNTLKYLKNSKEILEIGCGDGAFMKIVEEKLDASITGIELSKKAYHSALAAGLNVYKETIEEHKNRLNKKYDAVCSFQVLEHITNIREFLNDKIDLLNTNGFLIITVPCNDSIIFRSYHNILNCPPHHMGLWDTNSISKIQKFFPLRKIVLEKEPINENQINLLIYIINKKILNSNRLVRFVFFRFNFLSLIKNFIKKFPKLFSGHSMTIVFQKTC